MRAPAGAQRRTTRRERKPFCPVLLHPAAPIPTYEIDRLILSNLELQRIAKSEKSGDEFWSQRIIEFRLAFNHAASVAAGEPSSARLREEKRDTERLFADLRRVIKPLASVRKPDPEVVCWTVLRSHSKNARYPDIVANEIERRVRKLYDYLYATSICVRSFLDEHYVADFRPPARRDVKMWHLIRCLANDERLGPFTPVNTPKSLQSFARLVDKGILDLKLDRSIDPGKYDSIYAWVRDRLRHQLGIR